MDLIYGCLRRGGRLIYLGAGTSGRLGVLDASECPPTFGVDPAMVQGFIAGGDRALRHAVEGCEDSAEDGERLIDELAVGADDAVVGITASGSATYVLAAMRRVKARGGVAIEMCIRDSAQSASPRRFMIGKRRIGRTASASYARYLATRCRNWSRIF